jgi:hypothetical protein
MVTLRVCEIKEKRWNLGVPLTVIVIGYGYWLVLRCLGSQSISCRREALKGRPPPQREGRLP